MISIQVALLTVVAVVASAFPHAMHEPVHHTPKPYKFGYSIKDKHGEQHREESGNGGQAVVGSYGFTDARGVHRQVNYVADKAGFRAQVKTNEPGTANQNPAAVHISSNAHNAGPAAIGDSGAGVGFTNVGAGFGNAGVGSGNVGVGIGNVGTGPRNLGAGLGNAGIGFGNVGVGIGNVGTGPRNLGAGLGNTGIGFGNVGGGIGNVGTGPRNLGAGVGFGNVEAGVGNGGYGLNSGLLNGLGYARFGY